MIRVTKKDIINYIENKEIKNHEPSKIETTQPEINQSSNISLQDDHVEIIEMDRMRKIIAKHMISSKAISAHVTSFVEVDMTKIVKWRNQIKEKFFKRERAKNNLYTYNI